MSGHAFFVSGTDTGIGKTLVATRLMHALRATGRRVLAMKPVAAGCDESADGLRNEDVEALRAAASFPVERALMNPYAFLPAISPHLAAVQARVAIDLDLLRERLDELKRRSDIVLVEGAGGWYSPISATATMADLARALELPVVLVVGLRLGCLNHALLSAAAIADSALPLLGWVANCVDPLMALRQENIDTLAARLPCPLLGVVPHLEEPNGTGSESVRLDVEPLLR
jgi:dethiobiotin synthetase